VSVGPSGAQAPSRPAYAPARSVSGAQATSALRAPTRFAAEIEQLSEPGGYFNSNNLVSNERSYLQVVPVLRSAGLSGGAYVGVGPDQNFSYIAHSRPSIAFILDIRRDNLLLHLLFKALFQMSATRVGYLSLLLGRPVPGDVKTWRHADIGKIVAYVDGAPAADAATASLRARVDAVIDGFGVPLSATDRATIDRFHRTFIERGLSLQFESAGRPPRPYYPTLRELLLETDAGGERRNYLANEDDFQFVRSLQQRDLVIPVVGNLAGPSALVRIGALMKERGDRLSVFYSSNVEFYLWREGMFEQFVGNLARLPRSDRSLIVRSVFPGGFGSVPSQPGYFSASLAQRVDELLAGVAGGRIRTYRDLIDAR
jgi:hypothetical protein